MDKFQWCSCKGICVQLVFYLSLCFYKKYASSRFWRLLRYNVNCIMCFGWLGLRVILKLVLERGIYSHRRIFFITQRLRLRHCHFLGDWLIYLSFFTRQSPNRYHFKRLASWAKKDTQTCDKEIIEIKIK